MREQDSARGDTIRLGPSFAQAYATSKVAHSLVHTSGITIRRTLFDTTGGFAPELRIAEDYDLWSRCFAIGRVALLTDEPQSVYFRWQGATQKYEAACRDSVRRLRDVSETVRPFGAKWHRIRQPMAGEPQGCGGRVSCKASARQCLRPSLVELPLFVYLRSLSAKVNLL